MTRSTTGWMAGLRGAAALAALLALPGWLSAAAPQTGPADPSFAAVDTLMQNYLVQRAMPGAVLVVGYGDRIIYAQGYGMADPAGQIPMSPWLEFRLGSLSKTPTAAAV